MKTLRFIIAFVLLAFEFSVPASAQDDTSTQGILAAAKMSGACGILDLLIQFQKSTLMEGGDEFVSRFWSVEAARLGMSVEQLSSTCDQSIFFYKQLWDAAGIRDSLK